MRRAGGSSGHRQGAPPAPEDPPRGARVVQARLRSAGREPGKLVEIRGQRFGLPDRMNLVVGRVSTNPRGFGFVDPEPPVDGRPEEHLHRGQQPQPGDARRPRRRARRAHRATAIAPRAASSASSSAASERIVGRYELDDAGRGFVVPFDRRLVMDVQVPQRRDARRGAGRDGHACEITRWPTPTRPALGRVTEVLGRSTRRASTPRSSSASTTCRTRTATRPIAEAKRLGSGVRESDIAGPHGLPRLADRDDRRRARARLRRRDLDRPAAERQLLARRAHRRRRALRAPRAARSTPRPTSAARRCTFPSAPCTCFRRSCRRACAASTRTSIGSCSRA